ncbi:MAG TPA: enoyl-CoA hydratase family protein [Vicinamibacteria bacterium]|nr:enoyl-CoA hydratase family protein [Vicinamibacteria bacterium]
MTPRSFRYAEHAAIARITFDRPDKLNALTFEVYRELTALLREIAKRRDLRAVVLTGAGRAFCTGGDVDEIIGELLRYDREQLLGFTRLTCDLVRAMRALPRPIVASLNGTVAGAGAAIALASDFRVAAEGAKIAFLFVKVGLAGADMGAAFLLPRLVGLGRATELLMLGDFVEAAEAERIGLYHRVVPRERLEAETQALVDRLSKGPLDGLAETKRALNRELSLDLESALDEEARIQADLMRGPDFREGFDAFVQKRAPRFSGAPE